VIHLRSIHLVETHPRADMRVSRQRVREMTARLRDEVDGTPMPWPRRRARQMELELSSHA
jgi:hypothetical protein